MGSMGHVVDVVQASAPAPLDSGEAKESAAPVATSVLEPQATRANLATLPHARVADVIGDAQRFAPSTFAALLDASLGL